MKWRRCTISALVVLSWPAAATAATPEGSSSSAATTPAARPTQARPASRSATSLDPIAFDDVPLGTDVYDEYSDRGVVITSSVETTNDRANPSSPVLSGIPRLQGPIEGRFVDPVSGEPAAVASFTVDVGYIDNRDAVVVDGLDANDELLQRVPAEERGINTITLAHTGIARFSVHRVDTEPAGFAIDNLTVDPSADPSSVTSMASYGDSYSSGEGLRHGRGLEYDCGTNISGYFWRDTTMPAYFGPDSWSAGGFCDTRTLSTVRPADLQQRGYAVYDNECHRHGRAYPVQLAAALGVRKSIFVACSGATTANVGALGEGTPQKPLSPVNVAGGNTQDQDVFTFRKQQLGGSDPDVITIGIGGNDAGFATTIKRCLFATCGPSYKQSVINKTTGQVYDSLAGTFGALRSEFPSSTILAFGYPNPISDDYDRCGGNPLNIEDVEWLHDTLLPTLNQAVADAADAAGVSYIDITRFVEGHEVCSPQGEWVNGLSSPLVESFHPNQDAHYAITRQFLEAYTDGHGHLLVHNPPYAGNPLPVAVSGADGTIATVTATPEQACGQGCTAPSICLQGCVVHVTGEGYDPQARLDAVLHSEPIPLGSVTTDADGNLDARLQIPAGTPLGPHVITLDGKTADGTPQFGTAELEVVAPPSPAAAPPAPMPAARPTVPAVRPSRLVRKALNASIKVSRSRKRAAVTVRVGCPRAAGAVCAVRLTVRADRKAGRKRRVVATLRRKATVRSGRTQVVVLRAKQLRERKLRLRLTVATTTTAGVASRVISVR